jgi:hypothetical protein
MGLGLRPKGCCSNGEDKRGAQYSLAGERTQQEEQEQNTSIPTPTMTHIFVAGSKVSVIW